MVFLPEACDYICENTADTVKMAESKDGSLISKYKNLAQKYNLWLSLGGIHLKVSIKKCLAFTFHHCCCQRVNCFWT